MTSAREGKAHMATNPPPSTSQPPRPPLTSTLGWPWLLLLLIFLVANWVVVPLLLPEKTNRITVPYTTFREQVQAGNVAEITRQGDAIQGTFKQPVTYPPTGDKQQTSTDFET